jgi:hypothetical protein
VCIYFGLYDCSKLSLVISELDSSIGNVSLSLTSMCSNCFRCGGATKKIGFCPDAEVTETQRMSRFSIF